MAKVQLCLVMAVPSTPYAQQSDSHAPERLEGGVGVRQANKLHCGLEAAQGWQLMVSET